MTKNTGSIKEPLMSTVVGLQPSGKHALGLVALCLTILSSTFQKTFWYLGGFRVLLSDILMLGFCLGYFLPVIWSKARPQSSSGRGFLLASLPLLGTMFMSGFVNALLRLDVGLFFKGMVTTCFYVLFRLTAIKFISETNDTEQNYYPLSFVAGALISVCYSVVQSYLLNARGVDLDATLLERLFSPTWHDGIAEFGSFYKVSGLLADPNHFGMVIVTSLSIAVCLLIGRDSKGHRVLRTLSAGAILSLFVTLVFTFSRTALVALIVMFLVSFLLSRRFPKRTRLKILAGALIPFLLVVGTLFYLQKDEMTELLSSKADPYSTSAQEHVFLYPESFSMWTSSVPAFLFGVGPNNFSAAYQRRFGIEGWNPHSSWLLELVEGGLLGFLSYLALAGYVLCSGYSLFCKEGHYRLLGLAYTAAFSAVLVGGLFYDIFRWHYVIVFQAMVVGLRERALAKTSGSLNTEAAVLLSRSSHKADLRFV